VSDIARHFELAIQLASKGNDWPSLCAALRSAGFLRWDAKRDEAGSREAYGRAREIATKHEIAKELSHIHIDLAYLHTRWGDPKGGEEFARRAIDMCKRLGDRYGLANAYGNLGTALEALERWPDATSAFEESRKLAGALQNLGGQVFAERGLARLHWRAGERMEARSLLRAASRRAKKCGVLSLSLDIAKELKRLQKGQRAEYTAKS
jgi:tetratricopeptide (TPR) repeat protein